MSFSVMPPRRRTVITAPPPKKRRKIDSKIEEITFDLKEREDYLSGFHKRKVQRQKQAQAEAIKRGREEKLAARKILREGRKEDLRKHVEAVNAVIKSDETIGSRQSEDDENETEAEEEVEKESLGVDHEEEYVDEDKFTTVTVEAVDVSRDGLKRVFNGIDEEDESDQRSIDETARMKIKEKQSSAPGQTKPAKRKLKKKRFKYESKADRKVTRFKERGKGKKQAKERRGN